MFTSRPLPPPLYRLQQGIVGLFAFFQTVDDRPAETHLSPEAYKLYGQMSKLDRGHGLRVYHWLQARNHIDPDLLTAALLHDCGKSAARITVAHRTAKVLLKRLAPAHWQTLSRSAQPGTWRYPFYILRTHPARGSHWAEEAGCSPTTIWLIRHHETDPDPADPRYPLLSALQHADAVN